MTIIDIPLILYPFNKYISPNGIKSILQASNTCSNYRVSFLNDCATTKDNKFHDYKRL